MQFQLNTNGKEASAKNSSAMFIEIASSSISEIIFGSIALDIRIWKKSNKLVLKRYKDYTLQAIGQCFQK